MSKPYADFTLNEFSDALAAGTAAPGGGSTAAVVAALAASLAVMLARLTAGRPKFAAVDASMQQVIAAADPLRRQLLTLATTDAEAFDAVMAAFRLPKDSDSQKTERQAAIQAAYQLATAVPMQTLTAAVAALTLCVQVIEQGNPNAVTDGITGALLAEAAAQGAALNVQVNLAAIQDASFVTATRTQLNTQLARAATLRDAALTHARQHLPAA
jgi:formiminotetrahydrofolate cyclodeaminase